MERLLLSLAIFLISTSAAQAQFRCFNDSGCATAVVGPSNAEDCCVNNNEGLYYNDGGLCIQCIVYGFGSDNFTRPEAQTPYDFPFGYFKGPSDAQLRVAIDYNGEGTALEGEFGIGQSVVSLPLNPGGTTSITFQADRVALEPDETFVLDLVLLNVANVNRVLFASSLPNVFFRSRQEFIIQDSTALVFRLRESDRVVDERLGAIPVEVTVSNEVELASDISLVLTPMIAPVNFTSLPTTSPNARANTIPDRIDFFTTPITLNFTAGGPILLAGDVLIYDDMIDEALEYFVVTLTFQDPDNVPPLASIERSGGNIIRIDIIDDDDIFIGFALPNTTYQEVESDHRVQIIKGAGNVTEQTISFVVNLFQTAPEGLGNAIPSADGDDNDFFLPPSTFLSIEPEETETFVTGLNIFGDNLPEVTEAAQLRLSLPTETGRMFPGFETLPQYPTFFIIIEDDDPFRIGFENTSYIVNEGIGFLEVCVRLFEPPEDRSIGRLMVDLGVETVRGTADGDDYTEVTGARFAFFTSFNDDNRQSCIMVEIREDERYEFEEQFSLRFIELEGTTLPSTLVLDPARSNITIVDNEDVTVGFINPPYSAREDEGPMIFTVGVTSNHILDRDIELSFSTVDGLIADFAAMAGLDYTSIMNMPIILSPGMQTIQIAVELINDTIFEKNEMFQGILTIISGERVSLSPGTADATIIEDEVVCQELELLVNGRIEYSPDMTDPYLEGTNAEHICFPGFVLIGNMIRVCQSDSTFSGTPPTCQPIECPPLPAITNGFITYAPDTTSNYDLGTVATYACDAGFVLDLSLGGSTFRTCVDDNGLDAIGEFNNQAPRCIPIECSPLTTIINGFITYATDTTPNYDLGTVAFYACDAGFVLDISLGSTFRTCVDDDGLDAIGVFDNQAPRCVPIECSVLPVFANGMIVYATDVTPNFELGTTATYSCNEGYTLDTSIGVEVRTCIDDGDNDAVGVFSDQEPACIRIQCTPLPGIPNGRIEYGPDMTPNYMLGTTATYICNDGFFLDLSVGNEVRTCEDDNGMDDLGEFTGSQPTCVPIECLLLPTFTNGMISYSPDISPNFDLGTDATYTCDAGFFLDVTAASQVRTCIDDNGMDAIGVWSGQEPSCIPVECSPLTTIANGFITYAPDTTSNYDLGTVATYTCDTGFVLDLSQEGSVTRTCFDDMDNDAEGLFSGQAPACILVCQELELLVNGRIEYLPDTTAPYLEGTIAEHICFPGFVLIGNMMRICQNDSTFSGVPPTCQPIECLPLGQFTNGMITYAPDTTPNYNLDTVATYTCNEGFRLDITQGGSETRTCTDDFNGDAVGVFNNLPPRCVPTLMTVNDTVSGDPLFSVPLNVPNKTLIMNVGDNDPINLCFEVHGDDGGLFNLVSDACVSVNARYVRVIPNEDINIVDAIYVRATDANGDCRNIEVSLDQCSASIDDVPVTDYMNAGITVRRFRNRVRIVVPNCADIDLVMWVSCLNTTFWSRASTDENEIIFHANNIRFVIARGLDLAERSHGLLGQFWNVPIQVQPYTGPVQDGVNSDGYYVITTNHPNEPPRSFVGWLWPLTWEYKMEYCLYAGQNQAAPLYEILDDTVNSPVIFGEYTDYIVDSPYATDFSYSHFEESRCSGVVTTPA